MSKTRLTLLSLSLANLFLLSEWLNLFASTEGSYFHGPVPVHAFMALCLVVVCLAFVFGFTLRAACLAPWEGARIGVYGILTALMFVSFLRLSIASNIFVQYPFLSLSHFLGNWGWFGNAFKRMLVAGVLVLGYLKWNRRVIAAFQVGALLLVPALLFNLFHTYSLLSEDRPVRKDSVDSIGKNQVLWMVFDELDQHFLFEARPQGLQLPEFDRLQKESFSASNALPPSNATLTALPAFLTGRMVADAKPLADGDLQLQFCDSAQSEKLSQTTTVFSQAKHLGYRTRVAGWYHPYCRLLGHSLNACSWVAAFQTPYREVGVTGNVRDIVSRLFQLRPDRVDAHERIYTHVLEKALLLATAPNPGLGLIHWPIPHYPAVPGLVQRPRFVYPSNSSIEGYGNNLILADEALGAVRAAMEAAGTWENTTVLVTSDHWWRVALEGELEKTHYQVPFMLKMPGQTRPLAYTKLFNSILSSQLVMALLAGEITKSSQLVSWMDQHRSTVSPQSSTLRPPPGWPAWNCSTRLTSVP